MSEFRLLVLKAPDKLEEYFLLVFRGSSSPHTTVAKKMFSNLPVILPGANPEQLVSTGLWTGMPQGWSAMDTSARYFEGRRDVAVEAPVCPFPRSDVAYLALPAHYDHCIDNKPTSSEKFVTHRASLGAVCDDRGQPTASTDGPNYFQAIVANDVGGTNVMVVPIDEILRLNHPHVSPLQDQNTILLEDGIKCSYGSLLMRAKLCAMAVSIDQLVNQIDFQNDLDRSFYLRCQIVAAIRQWMNITRLQDGIDRTRTTFPSVGKLISYGQGHCHGLSSAMAACMFPFSRALGLDVQYRGGYILGGAGDSTDQPVVNNVERHQWLEITYRPSMQRTICDLSFMNGRAGKLQELFGPGDHCDLFLPVSLAYSRVGRSYPNGRLIAGTKLAGISPNDVRM
eukprot:TRINITY_DN8614_c5_g1_i1.p1 TRINITY_DN8614_c5_g1~~TRINITY_DN8614_c5_g1_i1.p1  ORF type:complete len:433 (-),score=48.80 TRINITY_DN8614_c5_g1_i1:56-1243(-)